MKLYNPFTKVSINYPIDFDMHKLNYHIRHETIFSPYFTEWAVSELSSGDILYIPYGRNMCPDIYVITSKFIKKQVVKPYGIYTIPMSYFTEGEYHEKKNKTATKRP